MKSYENTFIRGPSPSYSDEVMSEHVISASLPIPVGGTLRNENFLNEELTKTYDKEIIYKSFKQQNRKTFAFWTAVTILVILTVGNLFLTLTIIGVLHLGRGIHGMELIPEEDVIKFHGSTDLDRIYTKLIGQIEGFKNEPISITSEGEKASVFLRVQTHRNGLVNNKLILDKSGIQFRDVNAFVIKDAIHGANIFTTHRPHYNIPKGLDNLVAKAVSTSKISSPIDKDLRIEIDSKVSIKGSEGILLDSLSTLIQAEHNVVINSTQGATILKGTGIYLDMDKIPIVSSEFGLRTGSVQYKICVCMPQGILFRIAIPRIHNGPKSTCAHFSAKYDPCGINS
ncbi:uncharacterized protein LOC119685257 [Teleopsis dalmanni]|uniref:uncharacterized protein LOC119685257 n=1 Tax=Teleopsis dalmanni TaxID=139649 RepID=UPI0018CE4F63|nr:uncharacterized protein LOC119685257 [Teleopsis dalmanni]